MPTSNPFDSVTFDQNQVPPTTSQDEILKVLTSLNPPSMLDLQVDKPQQVDGGTSAGIKRVNANAENTGVVAFKDENGRAVLTDRVRDATDGKEKSVAALLRPSESSEVSTFANGPDVRNHLFEAVNKLSKTQSLEEANAIYSNIQQSLMEESSRLETSAFKFADAKFGVPQLLADIESNRALDKAAPDYVPGLGDSPITQRLVDQLRQVSASSREDAKVTLSSNLNFKSLQALASRADREFQRVQKLSDAIERREETLANTRETFRLNNLFASQTRKEERELQDERETEEKFNRLSAQQIARISLIDAADLVSVEGLGEKARQKKLVGLAEGKGKDKNYSAAINAEGPQQLLELALGGNAYAKKLTILEESRNTGMSTQEVEQIIQKLNVRMFDPKMPDEALRNSKLTEDQRAAVKMQLNPALMALDPNKKIAADHQRFTLLWQEIQKMRQDKFENDVTSWGATDPILLAAIKKAQGESQQATIENVAAAYLGEATDVERIMRLQTLDKQLQVAAMKFEKSAFGMPNIAKARNKLNQKIVEEGFFRRFVENMRAQNKWGPGILGMLNSAPIVAFDSLRAKEQ
jgi:hypothetical protein